MEKDYYQQLRATRADSQSKITQSFRQILIDAKQELNDIVRLGRRSKSRIYSELL